MTDPCSVLQTAEAIGGLIKFLIDVKTYCLKLKNARRDAFKLLERLDDGFDSTLLAIEQILHERQQQTTQDESQSDSVILGGVAQAAEKCKEALSAIYQLLRRFMDDNDRIAMSGILESNRFVQMKPRIDKQMTRLAEHKSTLNIAFVVLLWHDQRRHTALTLASHQGVINITVDVTQLFQAMSVVGHTSHTAQQIGDNNQPVQTTICLDTTGEGRVSSVGTETGDLGQQIIDAFLQRLPGTVESQRGRVVDFLRVGDLTQSWQSEFETSTQHGRSLTDASQQLPRDSGEPPLSDVYAESPIDRLQSAAPNSPEEEAPEEQTEIRNKISPDLLKAVKESNHRLVKILLDSGTDIDAVGNRGTALHYAVEKGDSSMIDLLLRHRADVNIKDSHQRTALSVAIKKNYVSVVKRLLDERSQQIDLTTRHDHDGTLLHYAVMHEDTTCTKLVVGCHPDLLSMKDRSGQTALHYSAKNMHLEQAILLLERGANANESDHEGRTPMFLALETRAIFQEDILRHLEKSGGKIGVLPLVMRQQTRWNMYRGRDAMAKDAQTKTKRTASCSNQSGQSDLERWRREMREAEVGRGRRWSMGIMRRWSAS